MKSQDYKRWQMRRFWERDPRCHYCKVVTVLVENGGPKRKRYKDNEATLEHLHSRLNPERGKHDWEPCRVLACRKCNNQKGNADMQSLPIQTRWERERSIYDIAKRSGAINEVDGWRR